MIQNGMAGIPESLTRFVQLPNELGHNAVWDFKRSPEGRFFLSVCGENEKPLTALLYEFYPDTGQLRLLFDVADIWIVDKQQMPPSKIHTSIDFLPDGKLIMATHNTAPAPGHQQWMFEQHYEHPWEGYPGSVVMIVDPDTAVVQIRGIPVPRESIYGGLLGDDPRYYYFLGYMRGHFYRLDLITNEVKDYGKVSEFSSCKLIKDKKGRIYSSSYTGSIWRYDPHTDKIEDLNVQFVSPNGTKARRQFIYGLTSPTGTLFMVDNMDGEMIEIEPETLRVTRHGPLSLPEQLLKEPYGIGGLEADEQFVLYYGLKTFDEYCPIRLVRWDILRGGKPENLGLIAPRGKDSQYICEMLLDDKGWLHMVDVCGQFSPYILSVDIRNLEPPGDDAPAIKLHPYVEPDYNGVGAPAYMHIEARSVRTLPLHQQMDWADTAVCHMRVLDEGLFILHGSERIWLSLTDWYSDVLLSTALIHQHSRPISAVDLGDNGMAVLTEEHELMTVNYHSGTFSVQSVDVQVALIQLHGELAPDILVANDAQGRMYIVDTSTGTCTLAPGLRLGNPERACVVFLDRQRLLWSGEHDELILYDLDQQESTRLDVRTPSIRGRAFQAWLTAGAMLPDGTVVAGTADGMLFTLSSDLTRATAYGRLYSSGSLRKIIRTGGNHVIGVYGDVQDAGHVFRFSRESGFVDLGRPRVIKDNDELRGFDTEWANIHYISCLAWSDEHGALCVASGELYGCLVRYQGFDWWDPTLEQA